MKRNIFVLLMVMFIFAACNERSKRINSITDILVTQEIEGDLTDREVIIHVPDNLDKDKLYPVVFAFHGHGGQNDHWVNTFKEYVNSGEFIGIYPQGHLRCWNLGQEESKADDVEFVNLVVEAISGYPNMDFNRMYAIGYSNGSGLVNKLGAKTSHFRAIACCATQIIQGQEPGDQTHPVSVYQLCGTADDIIPYKGGLSPVGHTFLSAMESAEMWAMQFNCNPSTELRIIGSDSLFVWSDCDSDREVRYHQVEKAGHGLNQDHDPDFYSRIWDFLKSQ